MYQAADIGLPPYNQFLSEMEKIIPAINANGFYSLEKDLKVKRPKKTKYFSNMVKNAVDFLDGKAELKSNLLTGINTLRILEDIKNQLKNELL